MYPKGGLMRSKYNVLTFVLCFIFTLSFVIHSNVNAKTNEKIYRIGVSPLAKYVDVTEDEKLEGYYIDFFDLIAKELKLNYEYVIVNVSESMNKLESGELDLCLGITITESRIDKILYNSNSIALEKFSLYTDKNINPKNLSQLDGLRFGTINGRATDWILDFFKASNIQVGIIYRNTYEELNELLDQGDIDLVLDSAYKKTKYNKIYDFIGSQVYIGANKNNKELLNQIDQVMNKEDKKIEHLYNSYFNLEKLKKEKLNEIIEYIVDFIFLIIIIRVIYPILKKQKNRRQMKKLIKNNNYLLYYDPIYSARTQEIIGFEAIVMDQIKNKYLVNAKELSKEVKDYQCICDLCIWKLKTVILDYEKIKSILKKDFYLSLNMPIHLFENGKFVNRIMEQLNQSPLNHNVICIEFSGNIAPKNMNAINENIRRLKEAGFIIAIDNFGIEYSNLNLIYELDLDMIKMDRAFTSNMDKNIIQNEIIMFITRIGQAQNKIIVLEGIDQLNQVKKIDEMNYPLLYVQGSFYAQPVTVENIKDITIDG